MFNHTDVNSAWIANVGLFDVNDLVLGGPSGIDNVPLKQLANRTAHLYELDGRYDGIMLGNVTTDYQNIVLTKSNSYRKLVRVYTANNKLGICTLPDSSTLTAGSWFDIYWIDTNNGAKNLMVTPAGSDVIADISAISGVLYLHNRECVRMVFVGSNTWEVVSLIGNMRSVGDELMRRGLKPGTLLRNGNTYNRADYPRLWAFAQASGCFTTEANWLAVGGANKSLFSSGNGSTTFRVPDDRGYFDRALDLGAGVDSDRSLAGTGGQAGGRQGDENKSHVHTANPPSGNISESDPGTGKVVTGGDINQNGYQIFPYNTGVSGGSESRPKNVGKFPLIIY